MRRTKKAIIVGSILCSWAFPVQATERFDVNLESGTPILEAVRALGVRANKDIVINGDIAGTISLHLANTTFSKALSYMATVSGFTYLEDGNVVLISPTEKMSNIQTFKVKYLNLEELKKQLGLFVLPTKINIDKEGSTVTVDGNPAQLAKVQEHLRKNDVAQKQINVQAAVIEINQNKARSMGLDYTINQYTKGDKGITWMVAANYEETKNLGKILAKPAVTVFNGKKASILIGNKVPVFTSTSSGTNASDYDGSVTVEYKEVGVKLDVTPRVNDQDAGTVTMEINPSISSITQWVESGNNKAPQISTREASTTLRVKEGETIYLGGLIGDQEVNSVKAIPFLSKLPVIGELFKNRSVSKQKTEIIIAITPTIIKEVNGVPQFPKEPRFGTIEAKMQDAQETLRKLRRELAVVAAKPVKTKEPKNMWHETRQKEVKDNYGTREKGQKNKK